MSANNSSHPHTAQRLDALDETLYRLSGFTAALRLLSDDLQLNSDTPQNSAFWAVLGGIDAALAECRGIGDGLRNVREVCRHG
jgi:hypothetical protein